MKNFKTILLCLFAIITATEMSYPIIFTGPARRQAHRKQTQEAYAAGMMADSAENDEISNDNPALAGNYAEDAVVQVQAIGDGSFLAKFKTATPEERKELLASATPEQKAALKARANNVKTQSMSSEDDQAVDEALQDAGLYDDVYIQAVEPEVKSATPAAVQSVQAVASSVSPLVKPAQAPAAVPAVATLQPSHEASAGTAAVPVMSIVHTEPAVAVAPVTPIAPVVAVPAKPATTPEQTQPAHSADKEVMASTATDKDTTANATNVVKVYPVYNAVRAAMHHIYSAAQDMINYAYNLVSAQIKPAQKEDVKVQILVQKKR